jgi:cytochrome oxidase assembly protein ShyY1
MKRIPLFATILVIAACATMIGLGIWQLQRAKWKEGLLAEYAAAQNMPPVAYPAVPLPKSLPLFRRSGGMCLSVTGWRAVSGRSAKSAPGWVHLASCRTGAEGPGMTVDAGWSKQPVNPVWNGGEVTGVIGADGLSVIRLVSDKPLAPGLQASAPPSLQDIPNNHRGYAFQWFFFAAIAALIFGLALRKRQRD